MKRFFRLSAFFVLGLLLGGSLVFYSGTASAVVQGAFVWNGLDGPFGQAVEGSKILGTVSPFNEPVWTPSTGGAVAGSSSGSFTAGAAQGAKVAVKIPVAVGTKIAPAALAKVVAKTLVPGGLMVSLVAPILLEAGLEYASGKYRDTKVSTLDTYGKWSNAFATGLTGNPYYTGNLSVILQQALDKITSDTCPGGVVNDYYCVRSPSLFNCVKASVNTYECRAPGTRWSASPLLFNWTEETNPNPPVGAEVSDAAAEQKIAEVLEKSADNSPLVRALPKGTPVDVEAPKVTGPEKGSATGPATTTVINNNTTTTTTTTTVNNVYNNNTVSSTIVNTTKTVDATGATTTTESPGVEDTSADDYPVTDTKLADVPKLYERKYPNGLSGVWNDGIGAIKATPIFSLPQVFAPNIDGGSCPVWIFDVNIGPGMMFGQKNIAPPCYIWPMLKAIMIISALMLARALIFGG